jgi:hypothetical protein
LSKPEKSQASNEGGEYTAEYGSSVEPKKNVFLQILKVTGNQFQHCKQNEDLEEQQGIVNYKPTEYIFSYVP